MIREIKVVLSSEKKPFSRIERIETFAKIFSLVVIPLLAAYIAFVASTRNTALQVEVTKRTTDVQAALQILTKPESEKNIPELWAKAKAIVAREYGGLKVGPDVPLVTSVTNATVVENVPSSTVSPSASPPIPWVHREYNSGAEAAKELSTQGPEPKDVYAAVEGGNRIHVWWKPGHSGYIYTYSYTSFDPKKTPLPDTTEQPEKLKQVPIGFGSAGSETVFVFFDAKKK